MVFHALIKWKNKEAYYRYLLTAPDADTVDEWWRVVSAQSCTWERIAPDCYTYTEGWPYTIAPEFDQRVIYSALGDRDSGNMTVFAHQQRTNHISGQSFYIRSKSNPRIHWLTNATGCYASELGRSRYTITIDGDDKPKVMIGTDKVIISLATRPELYLNFDENNKLVFSNKRVPVLFIALKSSFLAEGSFLDANKTGYAYIKKVSEGIGEEWELVK